MNKLPIFEWFYEQGDVYITMYIKNFDLLGLPPQCSEKKMETFVVGNSPTPHLTYDEQGIQTPMRFAGTRFDCFFPWENIIMMTGKNAVIQFTVPENEDTDKKEASTSTPKKQKTKKDRFLKVVK